MAPRSRSRSRSSSSRSKSRSRSHSPLAKRSRSYSRSRSRTPPRRRRSYSHSRSDSRSRSRSPYSRRNRNSRSPMSSRKRHVGNREAPPAGKCLGVFGLSLYTTEREVKDAFQRYGDVNDCNIVYDHASGRSRGFAFINMATVSGAEECKERLNGSELDGRRIRVDYSITQRPHTPTPGVYMGRPTYSSKRGYRGGGGSGGRYSSSRGGSRNDSYSRRSRSRSRSRSPSYRDRYY